MNPNPQIPQKPHVTATDAEWRAYLGELLDVASAQGVPALRLQGFTDPEIFELRRLATVYRKGTGPTQDLQSLRNIADKLGPMQCPAEVK